MTDLAQSLPAGPVVASWLTPEDRRELDALGGVPTPVQRAILDRARRFGVHWVVAPSDSGASTAVRWASRMSGAAVPIEVWPAAQAERGPAAGAAGLKRDVVVVSSRPPGDWASDVESLSIWWPFPREVRRLRIYGPFRDDIRPDRDRLRARLHQWLFEERRVSRVLLRASDDLADLLPAMLPSEGTPIGGGEHTSVWHRWQSESPPWRADDAVLVDDRLSVVGYFEALARTGPRVGPYGSVTVVVSGPEGLLHAAALGAQLEHMPARFDQPPEVARAALLAAIAEWWAQWQGDAEAVALELVTRFGLNRGNARALAFWFRDVHQKDQSHVG
jgi:hypothetical protein